MGGEAGCGGGGGGAPNGPSFGSPACSASSTRDPARTHPRGGRRRGRGPGGGGGPQASQPSPRQPPPVLPRALTCPEGATPEVVRSLRSTIMKVSIYIPGRGVVCHYQQHYSNCTPFTFQATSEQMALLKQQREGLSRYRNWLFSRSDEEACQWMRDQHGLDPWVVSYCFYCFYHF